MDYNFLNTNVGGFLAWRRANSWAEISNAPWSVLGQPGLVGFPAGCIQIAYFLVHGLRAFPYGNGLGYGLVPQVRFKGVLRLGAMHLAR